ncbi:2-hydroxyglutaryl-CoA dehydratase [Pelomyxa schiedti]|nr:2-hydroxyglutaryl-CoA dehydratase [Pelomyxa schiedti]
MKPIALSHEANRAVAGGNLHAETEAATAAATRSDSSPPANAGIVGHLLVGLDVGSTTVKLVAMAQQIRPASTEPTYWPVYNHEQIPTTNSPVGRSISYTSTTTAAARADPTPIITPQQGNAHTTTSLVDEFLGSLEFTTVFECYKRHRYDVNGTVLEAFREFFDALPDVTQRYQTAQKILRDTFSRISGITVDLGESEHPPSSMAHNSHENTNATASSDIKEENYEQCLFTTACVTGSCGMQLAEALGLPFVHGRWSFSITLRTAYVVYLFALRDTEVVACAEAVRKLIQQHVDVAIELGGEDAKIMRFTENSMDTQMNSTCAAGTGAFIDQMAALLQTDAAGLNAFALEHKSIHPIAARCAVFAKTDVQTLLSEGATKEDISASVLQAVAVQAIGGLSGGRRLSGNVVMLGGPMHFLPGLREAVCSVAMTAGAQNAFTPPHAHAMVCSGAALHGYGKFSPMPLSFLLRRVDRYFSGIGNSSLQVESSIPSQRLPPLFTCEDELIAFQQRHSLHSAKRGNIEATSGPLFIGIDSGSTTFKTAVIDCHGNLLHTIYSSHRGETMSTAVTALAEIQKLIGYVSTGSFFAAACATGYSEQLIKKAFRVEYGVVETMAHLKAAKFLHPDADFVLDIGGQDMKCISISEDGVIKDMFLNEACSSGCGSFIQSVANVLGLTIEKFVEAGLKSRSPVDLGTRCTVFMNSRVFYFGRIKQAQQDGASLEDISAGLAISVVKNALFKVMRVRSMTSLGKRIVVQGGMFLNDAVLRALEIVAGVEVIRPDIAGNMGAFGAALEAKAMWEKQLMSAHNPKIPSHKFHYRTYFGEQITGTSHPLSNMFEWQRRRVFRIADPTPPARCRAVFRALRFEVLLSRESSDNLFSMGLSSIPVDGCCLPIKLLHGHLVDLIKNGRANFILLPCEPMAAKDIPSSSGSPFERALSATEYDYQYGSTSVLNHCPLLSGYHNVIASNLDTAQAHFLHPAAPLFDLSAAAQHLYVQLAPYFSDITKREVSSAMKAGALAQQCYRDDIKRAGEEALRYMRQSGANGVVLACRPYHLDPWFGANSVARMLTAWG